MSGYGYDSFGGCLHGVESATATTTTSTTSTASTVSTASSLVATTGTIADCFATSYWNCFHSDFRSFPTKGGVFHCSPAATDESGYGYQQSDFVAIFKKRYRGLAELSGRTLPSL